MVRTVSPETVKFVRTMFSDTTTLQKHHALQAATRSHEQTMKEATCGHGIDRYLLGLRLLLRVNEPKDFFEDAAFQASSHWYLSTSQLSSEYFENKGWCEVVADGFGIGYMINKNSLHFNITNQHLGSHHFGNVLLESLTNLHQVCSSTMLDQNKL
jgi:carnitine O-acetyltransferase